jgi:hypothetical protein
MPGKMEKWKNGKMEKWKNGKMEKWKNGRMAEWQNGRMAEWQIGKNVMLRKDKYFGELTKRCECHHAHWVGSAYFVLPRCDERRSASGLEFITRGLGKVGKVVRGCGTASVCDENSAI